MNASPYFRYYAALVLLLMLVLMLRVQAQPAGATEQIGQSANPLPDCARGTGTGR